MRQRFAALHYLNLAASPAAATHYATPALRLLQHGEKVVDKMMAEEAEVRKTPSWPRSWANFSL